MTDRSSLRPLKVPPAPRDRRGMAWPTHRGKRKQQGRAKLRGYLDDDRS